MLVSWLKALFSQLKRRWKLIAILILIIGGGGFFWYRRSQAAQPTLTFTQPTYRDLTKTLEVSGLLDAQEKATLRFALGGKLVYLGVKEGDTIKKNQVIAGIDQQELKKRLSQDLNSYTQERLTWEQTLDDLEDQAPTTANGRDKQIAQLQLDNTVASVEVRDIAIKETRLISPIKGILVTAPATTTGINLLATDVFEVINPETLVFKAAVDESEIAQVAIGQTAEITLDAYPDDPFTTQISYISPKSQSTATSTVFLIRLPVAGDPLLTRYRLGMNGDVVITLETKKNVLSIPLDATKQRDGKTFVDVKTADATAEREITVGLETDEFIEVLSGLQTEDQVVLPETAESK